MEIYKIGSKGENVEKIQEKLKEFGLYEGQIDGVFGELTDAAVKEFQEEKGLVIDGIVGPKTWEMLFGKNEPEDEESFLYDIPQELLSLHSFQDSINWKLSRRGITVEGTGIERTSGEPKTVKKVWESFQGSLENWGSHFEVPCELIVATICTESSGKSDVVRKEPGFISDEETPHRVSVGLMQTLISTAREALENPEINREWLLNPDNSIQAGTAYITAQKAKTDFDPPKVACAYNAGGVYYQGGIENRWKMMQYPIGTSEHADRFIKWINDFFYLILVDKLIPSARYFK